MLKSIELDNYTTFFKPRSIDFTATNYKFLESENIGSGKILKGCLFVGENASGKTMILKSIRLLLELLFKGSNVPLGLYKSLYTNDESYKLKYVFAIKDSLIEYTLELSENAIISEKLILNGKEILNRINNSAKWYLKEERTFSDISSTLVFLRSVYFDTHFYNDPILNEWFEFIKNSIYLNCYDRSIFSPLDDNLLLRENLNEDMMKEINTFLKKIGYNHTINYSDLPSISGGNKRVIHFTKNGTNTPIIENFESIGNHTLVEILPSFLRAVKKDCMLIVDEFSSGLHNELEECLIKYFFHYAKNSQLFFTSHSTNILNTIILRPDQIYTVRFDSKNGSCLKRFSEEMPRESQNIEKMYLNGVFDGMPRYNKIFKD